MFKTVLTLFRGSVAAAGEELEDRTALLILDQQMRDAAAAAAVERSKRTLALAIAQDQRRAEGSRPPTPASPTLRSAPRRRSKAEGKISHAKRPRRSRALRRSAMPR